VRDAANPKRAATISSRGEATPSAMPAIVMKPYNPVVPINFKRGPADDEHPCGACQPVALYFDL